jgi:glutathione S-transferase
VDALLAEGVLGASPPTAADYQIATSVRLLLCFDDLREAIDRRVAGEHARALVPEFPGRVAQVLPGDWISGLR